VGTEEHWEGKKGFFIDTPCTSYSCASWDVPEDDRDHFGKSDWIWLDRCWEDSFVFSS
jgi:hypothetical protein